MAVVVPDILISDGMAYKSLRNNRVADGQGVFRQIKTGCGVSAGREYYVLAGERVLSVREVCNKLMEPIEINNFDFLVLKYIWREADGTDLDTATVIAEPPELTVDGVRIGGRPVGYGCGAYQVGNVIQNPGDNMGYGTECVCYDFRPLSGLDAGDVPRVAVESYATWYRTRGEGFVQVDVKAYKGGEMKRPANAYDFVNEGGTKVYGKTTDEIRVDATRQGPDLGVSDYGYSHVLSLYFDTRTGGISLVPYYS